MTLKSGIIISRDGLQAKAKPLLIEGSKGFAFYTACRSRQWIHSQLDGWL